MVQAMNVANAPPMLMSEHDRNIPVTMKFTPLDGVATFSGMVELRALGAFGEVASSAGTLAAAEEAANVWKLGAGPRGEALEQIFGHNLPGNMPVIDRFENGIATSIKSIDLDGTSYLTGNGLRNTLTRYVDKVAGYTGTGPQGWAGVIIRDNQITSRGLDVIVPHSGTAAQQAVLNDIVKYGASLPKPITVNVIKYP
jgi:filamentous hemagglutinin